MFNGAFATGISEGMSLEYALEFANKAASLSVFRKAGAALSAPYRNQYKINHFSIKIIMNVFIKTSFV